MANLKIEDLLTDDMKYKKADDTELDALYKEFAENLSTVPSILKDATIFDIGICQKAATKIIEQIRRRKLYFHIYHDIEDLNELKETALCCFWVLKLHPFFWKKNCDDRPNYELNAKIAVHLFTKGLNLYVDSMNKKNGDANIPIKFEVKWTKRIIETLFYSFRFRDWSKEAMMDLAESLIIDANN
jgi:hypothetical protein